MIRQFLITMNLPDWARWYAVDCNGDVWVYAYEPYINPYSRSWDIVEADVDVNCKKILTIADMTGIDWTQTLHEIERAA